jgi:hypothetical protein
MFGRDREACGRGSISVSRACVGHDADQLTREEVSGRCGGFCPLTSLPARHSTLRSHDP